MRSARNLMSLGWIASHLFVVAMVVLMVNLGLWQMRRLDERRVSNAQTASAMARQPVDIAASLDAPGPSAPLPEYSAVFAEGVYSAEDEVLVANRSSGGQPGYWMATPLRLSDGRAVAVVRGWVPRRLVARPADEAVDAASPPDGVVEVWGLAFESVAGGRIAVKSEEETPEISRMDLQRFEEASGVEVIDHWIRLRAQEPSQSGPLPVPVAGPDLSEGPHLSYAFQWFFFSAGAVVVYSLILRRALSRSDEPPETA